MPCQSDQYDFDFIVIGSGFGGSVTAHRLVEKGYKVAVMEMGRRWTPENLPRTSWSIHRWFWRPGLALRGFFNMRFFRHVTILHGCAVGGGSITYACTLLRPPDKVWDSGYWAGLADWKAEMPQHYDTASRMLGVTENKILGPGDLLLKRAAESRGSRRHLLPNQRWHFSVAGRPTRRLDLSRPVLRRRRSGAHHLQRLRRMHDGLPPRRQEHSRPELSLPRRKARRCRVSRDPGRGCPAARTASPTAAMAMKSRP